MRRVILAILFVIHAWPLFAASGVEQALHDEFIGKLVTLRGCYTSDDLRFDADGQLVSKSDVGSWTLYSKVKVTGLKVGDDKLKIEGNRVWVSWEQEKGVPSKIEYRLSPERLKIEVSLSSLTVEAANQIIPKIFLKNNENMSLIVPDLWKSFFG